MNDTRRPGASTPCPSGCGCSAASTSASSGATSAISLLVVVAGAILVPALSLPSALVAIVVGCLVGNLMLAVAGLIGAQARVPGDDADAGAARHARLVPADRDQRRAVPRLDGVRAARDRDRRRGALRRAARRRGAVAVDARLRRGRARDGAARADRRRAHGAAAGRGLGDAARDRLPRPGGR